MWFTDHMLSSLRGETKGTTVGFKLNKTNKGEFFPSVLTSLTNFDLYIVLLV